MTKAQLESQFIADMQDESKVLKVNDGYMARGMWNLVISIRDVGMYARVGMKPTRGWKITDVKKYFGVKGSPQSVLAQLNQLKDEVTELLKQNQ